MVKGRRKPRVLDYLAHRTRMRSSIALPRSKREELGAEGSRPDRYPGALNREEGL